MEDLFDELLEELKVELDLSDDKDIAILTIKLKNAFREIQNAINFKDYHTEEFILTEVTKYIGNIKDLTMYDFALVGGEGEISHHENGTTRNWKSRTDCFNGIVRYADF